MKAVLCRQFGPPETLELAEVPTPEPGPGELLIRVEACAVNFPDTLIIENRYQLKPPLPFSPGGEVAGRVAALGAGVAGPPVGTRVIAVTGHGGFAEAVSVRADAAVPVPEGVDPVAAATVTYAYGTTMHALEDRAALRPGETLLVLGASGGVGLGAVQLGRLLGARVIAAASTPEKLAVCREHGADALVDYTRPDWREQLRSLTDGRGVDVVYDPVGGPYAEPALRSMAWRGRYLVVGFAAGEIPRIPLNLTLLKGCGILGVFYGDYARREPESNRAMLARLLGWIAEGRLRPHVSAVLPLAEAGRGLRMLLERGVTGKVVLTT
ncbi:NADPH:quinone oxidoreductase family protein [Roseomonas sp. NAR14]|uniref:NADPH:quinone oxidoreductase family protein n=1 Tax=Roseomonas acroporae TaxID=2937791 RepID=A0A9X2BXU5_9PROT|nr:NADPH:quinone oxidoreductase family protein [Roseomonas acroporae]MCK8785340.1 NADPH:quinone oxidoreductase family protein [Roseomonas acroporae]